MLTRSRTRHSVPFAFAEYVWSDMHEEREKPNKNTYKVIAFTSAIKVLKQLDHPLRSIEEAKNVGLICAILCCT